MSRCNENFEREFKSRTIKTAKKLGYTNLYSLSTIKTIIEDFDEIEEEIGMVKTVSFFSEILICLSKKSRSIFEMFLGKLETNENLIGHKFLMTLFISGVSLPTRRNIYLTNAMTDAFERLIGRKSPFMELDVDEFNEVNEFYYDMLKHTIKETDAFNAESINYVYSIDSEDCVTICINTMLLLSKQMHSIGKPDEEEEEKYEKLVKIINKALYKNPFVDSIINYIDNAVDIYLNDKHQMPTLDTKKMLRQLEEVVREIIEYDADGKSHKAMTRFIENNVESITEVIKVSIFGEDEGALGPDEVDDIGPIVMDIENIVYNVTTTLIVTNYLALSLSREFDDEDDAIDEFKRILPVSSYLTLLLGNECDRGIYPTIDIEVLWKEMR